MAKPWDSNGEGSESTGKRKVSRLEAALANIGGQGGATSKQAKRMREYGFYVWARSINPDAPKGKRKKPTVKWIKDHFTKEQAGLILRELGYKRRRSSGIPKRPMAEIEKGSVYDEMYYAVHGRHPKK